MMLVKVVVVYALRTHVHIFREWVQLCHDKLLIDVGRFTEWLTHLAATLEVMGSRPSLSDISEIYFLESIQSLTQRDCRCDIVELTVICNVCGVNW